MIVSCFVLYCAGVVEKTMNFSYAILIWQKH